MTLNIALLKAKLPYFIALLSIGLCMNYLTKQLSIIHIVIGTVICLYAVLKPNTFCIFPKDHEYDKYDFMSALPIYLMMAAVTLMGTVIANHMGIISLDLIAIISIPVLTILFMGTIDMSRYS